MRPRPTRNAPWFWEPGKLIAGTLGAQGKSEPTLTAAMILKPTSVACERFIYLLDELVALMCCYMDSYSLLKFGRWRGGS